jgi:AcrR family transcriptional regulator
MVVNVAEPATTPGRRIRGLDAEQRKAQRREQLLDAALELFATHGYQNVSIEQICAAAYVGTKGFYEVFDSRESCHLALLERVTSAIMAKMVEAIAEIDDSETEDAAVAELIEVFAHALVDDVRMAKVSFGEGGAVSLESERQRRKNRRAAAALIEGLWARYDRPVDHAVAISVVGGMFDLVADWLVENAEAPSARSKKALIADLRRFFAVVQAGLTGA